MNPFLRLPNLRKKRKNQWRGQHCSFLPTFSEVWFRGKLFSFWKVHFLLQGPEGQTHTEEAPTWKGQLSLRQAILVGSLIFFIPIWDMAEALPRNGKHVYRSLAMSFRFWGQRLVLFKFLCLFLFARRKECVPCSHQTAACACCGHSGWLPSS